MRTFVLFLGLCLIGMGVWAGEAHALRCGRALVSKGDRKIEVLKSCGEPAFVEKWREKHPRPHGGVFRNRVFEIVHIEEWTYNFGSNQLIHFLTFRNGSVFEIEAGDYGFSTKSLQAPKNNRCGKTLAVGDKKIEVLKKCGEPSFKEVFPDRAPEHETYIHEEEWTYNFGSTDLLYFVVFKNNAVVRIEHGDYGF